MKIMCVIPGMTNGGAERVMSTLVNFFSIKNDVRLVVLKSDSSDYPISPKIDFKAGNIKNKNIIKSIRFVKKNLKEYNPDIVLSFLTTGNIVTLLSNKILHSKYKVIISERANPYRINRLYFVLRNITYPSATSCIFQTNWAQDFYSSMLNCKTKVIYNPLSPDFNVDKYNGSRDKRIVCTARLAPEKNQKLLINAFNKIKNKYPDYSLEIYGEGPEKENLQNLINTLSLNSRVKLMGRQKNIIDCIKSAAVFVLPSNSEGMSNALLEAMALGIPCIATDSPIGGSAIIIDNNINGLLIPMEDEDIMASAIEKIINDEVFAKKISSEASKVLNKFETTKICSQWEEYLKEIVG